MPYNPQDYDKYFSLIRQITTDDNALIDLVNQDKDIVINILYNTIYKCKIHVGTSSKYLGELGDDCHQLKELILLSEQENITSKTIEDSVIKFLENKDLQPQVIRFLKMYFSIHYIDQELFELTASIDNAFDLRLSDELVADIHHILKSKSPHEMLVIFYQFMMENTVYGTLVRAIDGKVGDERSALCAQYKEYVQKHGALLPSILRFDYEEERQQFCETLIECNAFSKDVSPEEIQETLSISGQLRNHDLTQFDSILIGCPSNTQHTLFSSKNYLCALEHHGRPLILDLVGYPYDAHLVGFDATNIEHWQILAGCMQGHRIKSVHDHTVALFDSFLPPDGDLITRKELDLKLTSCAHFIRQHILVPGGVIYALKEVSNEQTETAIDDRYFTGLSGESGHPDQLE